LLRLKGHSYNEINKILGVPKSTLSNWLSNVVLSNTAQAKIKGRLAQGFIKRNKEQTILAQKRAKDIRENATKEIMPLSNNDLLIIGIVLYWAEGYKRLKVINGKEITAHVVALTNSDPDIVSAFILFIIRILKIPIEKINIEIRLFKHIDAEEAISYWMKATSLSKSQFLKPMYPVSSASKEIRPQKRLPYGTVRVIVSDTKLFHRVLGLIDGLKEKLDLFHK
jgi:hypothetical protein